MGTSINLLPWREIQRQATRRRFFNKAVLGLVLVSLLVVAGRWVVYHQLTQQEARNARLQQEIDQLNTSLREFAKREVERDELQRRLTLVNSLQKQRNNATLLFNLLPQVIPDGVVLDKVSMAVGSVMIEGRSRDNAKLASLLALLESNAGVEHVQIHSIINNAGSPSRVEKNFRATFYLSDYVALELPEEDNNNGR